MECEAIEICQNTEYFCVGFLLLVLVHVGILNLEKAEGCLRKCYKIP